MASTDSSVLNDSFTRKNMNPSHHKTQLGQSGEDAVARELEAQGYIIVARNYRQRCGEIDLIARQNDVFTFVEIKTRKWEYFSLASVVTKSKQQKIIKTAKIFIAENQVSNCILRFDIATVLKVGASYRISYIPNAFTAKN